MWKAIITLIAIALLGLIFTSTYAKDPGQGKELTIKLDVEKNKSQSAMHLRHRQKTNNDFIISERVSAGLIFGLEHNIPINSHGLNPENKGLGLGLGFSLSF